ncbi:MAG: hypothetical protein J0L61_00725, partial [Planctomycetes bacterium]|nr:hypothetical protein [Planctomycetota bacterium]
SRQYDTGLTSLALLAFLGAGHTHESKADLVDTAMGKRHKIGNIVKKGLQWLVARQNQDGSFSPDRAFLYNEALASMAVSEAYGLTQARFWREPAQRSLDFLQRAQRPSPTGTGLWGWRYASRMDIEQFHRGAGSQDDARSASADVAMSKVCSSVDGVMAPRSARRPSSPRRALALFRARRNSRVTACRVRTAGALQRGQTTMAQAYRSSTRTGVWARSRPQRVQV